MQKMQCMASGSFIAVGEWRTGKDLPSNPIRIEMSERGRGSKNCSVEIGENTVINSSKALATTKSSSCQDVFIYSRILFTISYCSLLIFTYAVYKKGTSGNLIN